MRLLLERRTDVGYSVSATTRAPRNGEIHARDYFFVTRPDFAAMRDRGEFAESAEVHGNWYGTLRSQVDLVLTQEKHVIMDIDVQGARQFKAAYPESVMVFLLPPSAEALMQRLNSRRTETEDAFRTRLKAAREELRAAVSYQYAVVNDDLESAYRIVSSIVDAEAVRHARQPQLTARVTALVEELDRQLLQITTPA
jgi:guanylate kinase